MSDEPIAAWISSNGVALQYSGQDETKMRNLGWEPLFRRNVSWDRPLPERRTMFIYEAARLQAWAVDAPVVPEPWDERDDIFRNQMTEYVQTLCTAKSLPTPEAAHDSWWQKYVDMGWSYGPERDVVAKTHPDMVPFTELEQREQDKDAVFLALVELARDWIRAVSSEDVHREAAE